MVSSSKWDPIGLSSSNFQLNKARAKLNPELEKEVRRALEREFACSNQNVYEYLNAEVALLGGKFGLADADLMTKNLHVTPDYHGNRSPLADSTLCGAVCGLTLDQSKESLIKQYLATVQALAVCNTSLVFN